MNPAQKQHLADKKREQQKNRERRTKQLHERLGEQPTESIESDYVKLRLFVDDPKNPLRVYNRDKLHEKEQRMNQLASYLTKSRGVLKARLQALVDQAKGRAARADDSGDGPRREGPPPGPPPKGPPPGLPDRAPPAPPLPERIETTTKFVPAVLRRGKRPAPAPAAPAAAKRPAPAAAAAPAAAVGVVQDYDEFLRDLEETGAL